MRSAEFSCGQNSGLANYCCLSPTMARRAKFGLPLSTMGPSLRSAGRPASRDGGHWFFLRWDPVGTVLGQRHRKLRSFSDFARDCDFSVVRLDDGFHQAQAQAQAALGTALVATIEPRPDLVLLVRRDADASVPEDDHNL